MADYQFDAPFEIWGLQRIGSEPITIVFSFGGGVSLQVSFPDAQPICNAEPYLNAYQCQRACVSAAVDGKWNSAAASPAALAMSMMLSVGVIPTPELRGHANSKIELLNGRVASPATFQLIFHFENGREVVIEPTDQSGTSDFRNFKIFEADDHDDPFSGGYLTLDVSLEMVAASLVNIAKLGEAA